MTRLLKICGRNMKKRDANKWASPPRRSDMEDKKKGNFDDMYRKITHPDEIAKQRRALERKERIEEKRQDVGL